MSNSMTIWPNDLLLKPKKIIKEVTRNCFLVKKIVFPKRVSFTMLCQSIVTIFSLRRSGGAEGGRDAGVAHTQNVNVLPFNAVTA